MFGAFASSRGVRDWFAFLFRLGLGGGVIRL